MNDDFNRFRALCFLYACGKLDASETSWMQQMLLSHPELKTELEADQQLVTAAREAYAADRTKAAPLVSFDTIVSQIEDKPSSLISWLVQQWNRPMQTGWALTAVATLVIATAVQTYQLRDATQVSAASNQYRGGATAPSPNSPMIEVVFADAVTVSDLRRVLPILNLAIICGPDQQGVTHIAVQSGSAEQALTQLNASKLVIDAHLVQGKASCAAR